MTNEMMKMEIESAVASLVQKFEAGRATQPERISGMIKLLDNVSSGLYEKLETLKPTDLKFYGIVDTKNYLSAFCFKMGGIKNMGDNAQVMLQAIGKEIK